MPTISAEDPVGIYAVEIFGGIFQLNRYKIRDLLSLDVDSPFA
jgi:hypothetical protein